MGKGIAVPTTAQLVILIGAVLFLSWIVLGPGKDYAFAFMDWLFGKQTEMDRAIACSYYRCVNGCDHLPENYEFRGLDGSIKTCKEDFCDPIPDDDVNIDLKDDNNYDSVCGWASQLYPVEFLVDRESAKKTFTKTIGRIDFNCLVPLDTPEFGDTWRKIGVGTASGTSIGMACVGILMITWPSGVGVVATAIVCPIAWGITYFLGTSSYDLLLIDPALLDVSNPPDGKDCQIGSEFDKKTYSKAVDSFTVPSDSEMYIFSSHDQGGATNPGSRKVVSAISFPPYITINKGQSLQAQLVRDNWNRIHVKDADVDVLVKPKILQRHDGGWTWQGFTIRCPSGDFKEGLADESECKTGDLFCDDQFFISCIDVSNGDESAFSFSYGILPPSVELFENDNFGGTPIPFTKDDDNLADNSFDNKASSVRLPSGWAATLFENANYGGRSLSIAGDSTSLGLGDAVSSIRIDGPVGCEATLYENENYGGSSKIITSAVSDLSTIEGPCWVPWPCGFWPFPACTGKWEDCASSIKVKEGCNALLYENKDYGGNILIVFGESSSLHFNDVTSSLKVFGPASYQACTSNDDCGTCQYAHCMGVASHGCYLAGRYICSSGVCTSECTPNPNQGCADPCMKDCGAECEIDSDCGTGGHCDTTNCVCSSTSSPPPSPTQTCASYYGGGCDLVKDCTGSCFCSNCLDCTIGLEICCCVSGGSAR